jgi:DNA-directed RNA polymerase subunit RPC12/RpoP
MRIIDSPFHITFSIENKNPQYACVEKCKSIYWLSEINKDQMVCEKCGGKIEEAIKKVHYKILKQRDGSLNLKDFTKYMPNLSNKEKTALKAYTESGARINLLSMVKPRFIDKAKKEWC